MRKNLFPRSGRALEQPPRAGPESPSMATSQTHLDTSLCHLPWWCRTGGAPEGPSSPSHSRLCFGAARRAQGSPFHRSAQTQHQDSELCPAAPGRASPCFVSASLRAGVIISLLSASSFLPVPAAPSSSSRSLCLKTRNYSQLAPGITPTTGTATPAGLNWGECPHCNSCFYVSLHFIPLPISNLGQ